MNIRIKKQHSDGILRLETFGEIKEIFINQDFMEPKKLKKDDIF